MTIDELFTEALDMELEALLKRLQIDMSPKSNDKMASPATQLATRTFAARGLLRFEQFLPRYGITASRIERIRQVAHGKG